MLNKKEQTWCGFQQNFSSLHFGIVGLLEYINIFSFNRRIIHIIQSAFVEKLRFLQRMGKDLWVLIEVIPKRGRCTLSHVAKERKKRASPTHNENVKLIQLVGLGVFFGGGGHGMIRRKKAPRYLGTPNDERHAFLFSLHPFSTQEGLVERGTDLFFKNLYKGQDQNQSLELGGATALI